jgi:hypothetical protein
MAHLFIFSLIVATKFPMVDNMKSKILQIEDDDRVLHLQRLDKSMQQVVLQVPQLKT